MSYQQIYTYKPKRYIIFHTRLGLDFRWTYLTFDTILAAHDVESVYILSISHTTLQTPASLSINDTPYIYTKHLFGHYSRNRTKKSTIYHADYKPICIYMNPTQINSETPNLVLTENIPPYSIHEPSHILHRTRTLT